MASCSVVLFKVKIVENSMVFEIQVDAKFNEEVDSTHLSLGLSTA